MTAPHGMRVFSRIAHDINNALSVIAIYSEMLSKDTTLMEQSRSDVSMIQKGTDVIRKLAAQLKTMAGGPVRSESVVDVNELVESSAREFRADSDRRLLLDLDDAVSTAVADPNELHQCIMHLLHNAADATRSDGSVSISTRADGDSIMLEIADDGRGISADQLPIVCEPYYSTRGRAGIGLAYVLGAVHARGGRLEIDSAPGDGTRCRLHLRRKCADTTAGAAPSRGIVSAPVSVERILLIDDEPLIGAAFKRRFRDVDVEFVDCGKAALEILQRDQGFDLILCDLMMPGMSGTAFYEQLKSLESPLLPRVVFCSGMASGTGAHPHPAELGVRWIEKPVSRDQVHRLLEVLRRP